MKRILFFLISAISLFSCSRYDGTDYFSPSLSNVSGPLQQYTLCIPNDIVTGSLVELESALRIDKEGTMGKYIYQSEGASLSNDGSVWTVLREGALRGATISKVTGETAWVISFDGKFDFNGCNYPTRFELKATAADAATAEHRNWKVELNGTRTEDDGYVCKFTNIEAPVEYTAVESNGLSWNAFGYMRMDVLKNGAKVDALIMEIRGGITSISITHI